MLSGWVASVEGTDAAPLVAAGLALMSAVAHALFGALQKGRYDPWLMRGAIDISYGLMALPFALLLWPLPDAELALILVGVFVIHAIYKGFMGMAYSRAAYTVVYPVVRGLAPLITVVFAGIVFGEQFELLQWLGVAVLSGAIFALAGVNLRSASVGRAALQAGLIFAALTGVMTAIYTTYDAYGIRATPDPFQFLVWFFVVDGLLLFPWIALRRWRRMSPRPDPRMLLFRGWIGGCLGFVSFGAAMLATRLGAVGEAAVLRETSTVFAALIGWAILKEPVGPLRAGLMALIAAGAVLVQVGG